MVGSTRAEKSTIGRVIDSDVLERARQLLRRARTESIDAEARLALALWSTTRRNEVPARELEFAAGARRSTFEWASERIATYRWGEAGPKVLLMHGWEGRATQLGPVGTYLARRGFRTIGFDAPAHGESSGQRATLFDFAELVLALAEAEGPFYGIVAHSMGGAALAWASHRLVPPHSRRRLADRYTMIAPPADLRDFTRGFGRMMKMAAEANIRLEQLVEERYGVKLDDACAEVLGPSQSASLLVVHDIGDKEVPYDKGRRNAKSWPGATLMKTEGLGHQRILRDAHVHRAIHSYLVTGEPLEDEVIERVEL